ncbi:MAG: hypothetical protein WAS33_25360 [Candidatus Promineifilaceae bacterium]
MNRFWQQRYHRTLDAEMADSQTLAFKGIGSAYALVAGLLNTVWFVAQNPSPASFSTHDLIVFNLFLLGTLLLFAVTIILFRYTAFRSWYRCKVELLTQLLSGKWPPPSHLISFGALAIQQMLVRVASQAVKQTLRHKTPQFYRVKNTPFLLFQQAPLLTHP